MAIFQQILILHKNCFKTGSNAFWSLKWEALIIRAWVFVPDHGIDSEEGFF